MNFKGCIIGLTGRRSVGKSEIARYLQETYGFRRVHPFDGGKAACRAYFEHLGVTPGVAWRMTDGDLKDVPADILPRRVNDHGETSDTHYDPRYFMEVFGAFMGREMGNDWTIGREIERARRLAPDNGIVIESIVYEVDFLRSIGGSVVMVDRPNDPGVSGVKTDAALDNVTIDAVFRNTAETVPGMLSEFDAFFADFVRDTPRMRSEGNSFEPSF